MTDTFNVLANENTVMARRSDEEAVLFILRKGPQPMTKVVERALCIRYGPFQAWRPDFSARKARSDQIASALTRLTYEGDVICTKCSTGYRYSAAVP
jgi:hypothetical protein